MGRELTGRHFSLFENKLKNPFAFIRDVYQYEKYRELLSFLVWELFHQFRLFPKRQYLRFSDQPVLSLKNEQLDQADFANKITTFFESKGLQIHSVAHKWKLLSYGAQGELFGCIYPDDRDLYKSVDNGKTITLITRLPASIKSIFVSSQNTVFVCAKGAVYRSIDHAASFDKVLEMGSAESFFRHNNEMTETPDNTLIIGEYGNIWDGNRWRVLAYLYFSADNGATWETSDFLFAKKVNKHVHLVKYSKLFNKVYMADGDNYKKVWETNALTLAELRKAENWKPINRFHIQMGGYTSVIENDEKVIFGTDYQGGTNFLVATSDGKKFTKTIVPDPYRRSPIDNMVQRKSQRGNEIWANLPYSTSKTKCLLMYTADGGKNWERVIEYNGAAYKVWLISSSQKIEDALYISIMDAKNNSRVVYRVSDN